MSLAILGQMESPPAVSFDLSGHESETDREPPRPEDRLKTNRTLEKNIHHRIIPTLSLPQAERETHFLSRPTRCREEKSKTTMI